MSTKKPKKKMGRPKIEIDIEQVKKLCQLHCTAEEIAGYFEIDNDTLVAKIESLGYRTFSEFFSTFSAKGKISLRRKQYEFAMKGNTRMLEKLGDNWLGQSSKQQIDLSNTKGDIAPQFLIQVVNDKPNTD